MEQNNLKKAASLLYIFVLHGTLFSKMVSKGHRTGKIATHQCCYGDTWYVILEEEEMEKKLGKIY